MSFRIKADGGSRAIDRIEVRRSLEILLGPGEHHELRGLGKSANGESWAKSRLIHEGEWEAALDAAHSLSDGFGVYYTLNPVQSTLGDKSANAKNVVSRRWLLVDVDRRKDVEPDQCATEQERNAAFSLAMCCHDWLIGEGWPGAVLIDSGNGAQMLYRVDLPAERLAHLLIQRVLNSLADRWSSSGAEIDIKVFDAPRIARLPGTWNRKGISTEERPHRLCRLLHVPDPIEIVTVEQLEAVAGDKRPTPQTFNPWAIKVPTGAPDKLQSYVRSAIERELARVVLANPGNRNDTLNTASFAIGQLVGAHVADRSDVEKQLTVAALRTGLGDTEIAQTLRSGLEAGIKDPRTLPPTLMGEKRNGHTTKAEAVPLGKKLTVRLKDIKPEKVDWFYENRVAPGFISIFAGRTGFGKSFATCDIVAKASRGFPPPFSSVVQPPTRTLFVSEDSPGLVIAPRLLVMGADPEMVDFLTWDALGAYTLGDTDMLERAYQECGQPRLVVIDPPSNFLGGVDAHKDGEVRAILKLLVAWLDTHRVACIFIMHINKQMGKGMDAVERIVGSVAWGSTARMTLAFVKDPDVPDQYLFGGTKNNLGPLADTLAYRFSKQADGEVFIDWIGKTDTTMENAMNQVKKKSRGVCAVEWLTEQFRAQRQWESDEITKAAKEAGISRSALWSPEANALPISKKKRVNAAGEPCWMWIADDGWPPEQITETVEPVETVGEETPF